MVLFSTHFYHLSWLLKFLFRSISWIKLYYISIIFSFNLIIRLNIGLKLVSIFIIIKWFFESKSTKFLLDFEILIDFMLCSNVSIKEKQLVFKDRNFNSFSDEIIASDKMVSNVNGSISFILISDNSIMFSFLKLTDENIFLN